MSRIQEIVGVLVVSLVVALAAASLVQASDSLPDYQRTITRSQQIALDYWAQHDTPEPICSPVELRFDVNTGGSESAGAAPAPCFIEFDPVTRSYDPVTLCGIVVHEYGHLGYAWHSDDPTSIMYGNWPLPTLPACAAAWRETCSNARQLRLKRQSRKAKRHRFPALARALSRQAARTQPECAWSEV